MPHIYILVAEIRNADFHQNTHNRSVHLTLFQRDLWQQREKHLICHPLVVRFAQLFRELYLIILIP